MALEEREEKLKAALDRFHTEIERLKRDHEVEIQKILKEIDVAQMENLKKQLGI